MQTQTRHRMGILKDTKCGLGVELEPTRREHAHGRVLLLLFFIFVPVAISFFFLRVSQLLRLHAKSSPHFM